METAPQSTAVLVFVLPFLWTSYVSLKKQNLVLWVMMLYALLCLKLYDQVELLQTNRSFG